MVGGIGDDRARRGTEPEGSPDQTRLYRPWTLLYLCTNRYYYYNNSSTRSRQRWAVWRMGSFQARRGTVAIACQHCTCRFCSLLCCHCILLRRFDNSFYLRPGRCQGLGLFVCHLRRLSHFLRSPQSAVRSSLAVGPSWNRQFNSQWRSSFSFLLMATFPLRALRRRRRRVCFPPAWLSFCHPKVDINFCSILLFSSSFSQREIYNCIYVKFFE